GQQPQQQQPRSAANHLTAARQFRADRKYAEAERENLAAVQDAEKQPATNGVLNLALWDLGLTYLAERKYPDAERVLTRATDIAGAANIVPRNLGRQFHLLGQARDGQGHHDGALTAFDRAIQLVEGAFGAQDQDVATFLTSRARAESAALH